MSSKKKQRIFAFDRVNFILLAVGMAVVILGMILMSGSGSSETEFNPSIFDVRHIKVAPAVCLFGYLFIIYAIVRRPKLNSKEENELD
ncbi:MAG: DUF3098 domain-containing protein [Alloprevotella sp.]